MFLKLNKTFIFSDYSSFVSTLIFAAMDSISGLELQRGFHYKIRSDPYFSILDLYKVPAECYIPNLPFGAIELGKTPSFYDNSTNY